MPPRSTPAESSRTLRVTKLTADQIVELLQRLACHGVPENVIRGVRDFCGSVRTAYLLEQNVVVLVAPELAEKAATAGLMPGPLPGVFVADKRGPALRALEKAGFTVPAAAESDRGETWRLGQRRPPYVAIDGEVDADEVDVDEVLEAFDVDDDVEGVGLPDALEATTSLESSVRAIEALRSVPRPSPCPRPGAGLDDAAVERVLAQLRGDDARSDTSQRVAVTGQEARNDRRSGRELSLR